MTEIVNYWTEIVNSSFSETILFTSDPLPVVYTIGIELIRILSAHAENTDYRTESSGNIWFFHTKFICTAKEGQCKNTFCEKVKNVNLKISSLAKNLLRIKMYSVLVAKGHNRVRERCFICISNVRINQELFTMKLVLY